MWWPEDVPAASANVTWHGSPGELSALYGALRLACTCRFNDLSGAVIALCPAHAVLSDQLVLDHLVHVRRMRNWFVENEMRSATQESVFERPGPQASEAEGVPGPEVTEIRQLLDERAAPAVCQVHALLARALARQQLHNAAKADVVVAGALAMVMANGELAQPGDHDQCCRVLTLVRWRCRVQRGYRGADSGRTLWHCCFLLGGSLRHAAANTLERLGRPWTSVGPIVTFPPEYWG